MIRADYGLFNNINFVNIETKSSTTHCLDFYYYLTDALDDAKIAVGWEANGVTESIVEVTALSENKWQHSRVTFTSPSSEIYMVNELYLVTFNVILLFYLVMVSNDTEFWAFRSFHFRFR